MQPKFPKWWRRSVSVLAAAFFFRRSSAERKLLSMQINHSTCITCMTRSCLCGCPPLHVLCQVAESINSLLTFMSGISDFDDLIRKIESVANSARYDLDELTERCNASLCLCLPPSLPACLSAVDKIFACPHIFLAFWIPHILYQLFPSYFFLPWSQVQGLCIAERRFLFRTTNFGHWEGDQNANRRHIRPSRQLGAFNTEGKIRKLLCT